MRRPRSPRHSSLGVWILLAVFGSWYVTNISGSMSIDETFYATFGYGLLHGAPYVNPTHAFAPTGKYLIAIGQLALGETSTGARLPIVVVSLLSLYLTYRLGVELHGRLVGGLGMVLLGLAHQFSSHAVMAVLDIPLTCFFLAVVLGVLRWLHEERRADGLLIGVATMAALTTKAYGFLYVAFPVGIVVGTALWRYGLRDGLRALQSAIVAGAVTLVVVYLPFVLVPHPPLTDSYGSAGVMSLVTQLLSVPVLGNFVYIFGAAFVQNVLHLGGGHTVVVGSEVYQYPPIWAYLYWIGAENGVFYLGALLITLGGTVFGAVRNWDLERALVAGSIAVPLVSLSLLTVKFPRYIIPILPLVTIGVGLTLVHGVAAVSESDAGARIQSAGVAKPALVVGILLVGLAVPPSAAGVITSETIRTDTGFQESVEYVEQYADDREETVVVLTYHYQTFDYYFDDRPDVDVRRMNMSSGNRTYFRTLERQLRRGEIDLVVDLKGNQRMQGTGVYEYVRAAGTEQQVIERADGRELVVYELPDR